MSKIEPKTLKGFRDFLPEQARKRNYVINTLKKVFESYGFEPLETPALEYEEILAGKYGDEGDRLMYKFKDRGERNVALRYDQTVPLARVVAQYGNELPIPFKRYQIQPVWRAENTQKGRFREFLQCDADIIGSESVLSDAEVITLAAKSIERLGFESYKVLFNSREILFKLTEEASIPVEKRLIALQILDKQNKVKSINELKSEWVKKELNSDSFDQIEKLIKELSLKWRKEKKTDTPLDNIYNNVLSLGINPNSLQFMPSIVRGLDYYTGMIFEVEIEGYSAGSVCGGGRYDNLIGLFTDQTILAVGFAFGFDRIIEAMDQLSLFPEEVKGSVAKVLVTVFDKELLEKSIDVSSRLRSNDINTINTELWLDPDTKLDKQIKYADKKGIQYVVIIGPDEAKNNTVTVKDLKNGEQKTVGKEDLISFFNKP